MAAKKTVKPKPSKPARKAPRRVQSPPLKNDKVPARAGGHAEPTLEKMLTTATVDDIPTRAGESAEKESE